MSARLTRVQVTLLKRLAAGGSITCVTFGPLTLHAEGGYKTVLQPTLDALLRARAIEQVESYPVFTYRITDQGKALLETSLAAERSVTGRKQVQKRKKDDHANTIT